MANELEALADRLGTGWDAPAPCDDSAVPPPDGEAPAGEAPASGPPPVVGGRPGWPVEPADVFLLDPAGFLGVCTLGDPELARSIAGRAPLGVAAVGPLATENLGLEKLVRNCLALPSLEKLLVVGPETGGTAPTGHYAGHALACLVENGAAEADGRIRGARGARPFLRNIRHAEAEAFRQRISLCLRVGVADVTSVLAEVEELAGVSLRASVGNAAVGASVLDAARSVPETPQLASYRMRPDDKGYLLVFADHGRDVMVVEHYTVDDERTGLFVGRDPRLLALTVLDAGVVGRLDHAAYLGRELERAAGALERGRPYVQDAAPDD